MPLPENLTPEIHFEDPHLVVLSKPAGLLSQGEITGDMNLVDWLREHFGRHYVGLVHRLDRNTSGIMVVAKRTKSANRLSEALREGKICRTYLGWLEGKIAAPVKWSHRLVKDEKTNLVRVVAAETLQGKEALLQGAPVGQGVWHRRELTVMEFVLETGRSHQIRVQSAFEGHPLLGDRKYGSQLAFPRPALHSWKIRFPHPMSDEALEFESPVPRDLHELGWK